jgi:hypothetical protein
MKCDEVQAMLIEYIDGGIEKETRMGIDDHLKSCSTCTNELNELRTVIEKMDKSGFEVPGDSLTENFNVMLRAEMENLNRTNRIRETPMHKIIGIKWSSPLMRIAAGFALLIAGITIGLFIQSGEGKQQSGQLSDLRNEMQEMKQLLMLTMLNGESASERIKAVNYSSEISYPDQKVITALISTLNNDRNVNVRMAAAYSLSKFWDHVQVRDSLVASLGRQDDPIIQIVLINILTENREVKAIGPMREIITHEGTMKEVRDIAEKSIAVLM